MKKDETLKSELDNNSNDINILKIFKYIDDCWNAKELNMIIEYTEARLKTVSLREDVLTLRR